MTKGRIFRQLIGYAVPLVLGNLFQLAYNAVDSMIAGRFIGTDALAATGMAGPVMNILILGISGLCIGAGVIMSAYFGAKDHENLKKELSTLLIAGTVFSIAVAALGIIFAYPLMRTLNVPDSVLDITVLYLRIIFIGAPFTYFYNALSQALSILAVLASLVVPWLVLLGYARLRDMRVRPRRLTAGVSVVLLALVAAGMLVGGGWYGLEVRLGSDTLSVNAFAPIAYAAALAALAPHLLWPKTRETLRLDEERCVLYLRGRGAGELQAHVLLKIALGLSTPEVCEALHVAPGTVNAYRAQGYELLGVHTSRQLADLLARDVGCVPSAGKIRPSADDSDTSV